MLSVCHHLSVHIWGENFKLSIPTGKRQLSTENVYLRVASNSETIHATQILFISKCGQIYLSVTDAYMDSGYIDRDMNMIWQLS